MWAQNGGWLIFLAAILSLPWQNASQWHKDGLEEVRCPIYIGNAPCDCLAASDGLDFTCNSEKTKLEDIRAVVSAARFAIKTLVVTKLDANATWIPERTFANGSVNDFTIQTSNLVDIEENAFEGTHQRLHTLSIHNSLDLKIVPRAVSKIAALRRLDLSNNAIEEIYAYTFFGSAKLSYLNLEANNLAQMAENAFLGLENTLRELNLKDNNFDSFPMSAVKILKKLQSLNLANNRISNITAAPFTRLDTIRLLDLNGNAFTYLDKETLGCMPSLQRLWMANNGLEDIEGGSLSGVHDLETIDLSGNSLTDLPRDIFAHTRRLISVDLSRNKLKSLMGVFTDLFALEEVFLNDNLLLSFSHAWFKNTPNVKLIHLEHNVLVDIEDNAMQPLKRLSQLYLSHNFLSVIQATYFRYNVALTNLHLDNNHISSIDATAFRGVPKLRALRLDNNNLKTIDRGLFASLTSLTELHLQDNKVTEIEPQAFSSLANLAHLDVTGNRMSKLEDIMMRYPSNLKALYLDHNRLQTFHRETFSGQTSLDVLSLSDNKLERIPSGVFVELINLFRLSLANNRIAVIEDNALTGLHRVRFLDVSNNRLSRLTNATLRGLQQAEVVDLSQNRIASIQPEAFWGFHHIRQLDLSFNKLRTIKSGAFRGCLTLKILRLHQVGVAYIEPHALDDFVALQELDLSDNQLVMPNSFARLVKALPALKLLKLSGNDLTNLTHVIEKKPQVLSLAPLTQLHRLDLERCQLTNISSALWSENDNLKIVKLGGNLLSHLPEGLFAKQIFLEELHLDRNLFDKVPNEAMKYLYHLSVLNMSGNAISKLGENSFDYVTNLASLDLSANNMRLISERAFHNVTKLRQLNLENNLLESFFTRTFLSLADLISFRARGNFLPYIPVAVQGLRQVADLDFSINMMERLKEIPESRAVMKTVTSIKMTDTNLTTITPSDFDLVPNLLRLELNRNKLSRVAPYAFRRLHALQFLDMSLNQVMHLSRERFIGLHSLQHLNLSKNALLTLDVFPSDLGKLVVLDVSHNRIHSLARDSMTHLTSLVRLDLRGNLLTEIMPEVLHPMPSIKALDLAHNSFSVLPLHGIQAIEDTLESVSFEGNPLICSCQSYVQKIWLRQHRKWLSTERRGSKVGPQCSEPTPILDRYLLTVKDSELCPLPSVSSLQLSHIRPHSFLLTWESPDTNMTGLKGFIVAYHRLDMNDQVKKFRLPPSIRGFKIDQIMDDTLYLVCVVTRGSSWRSATSSDLRLRSLTENVQEDDLDAEDYDIEALETLGLIRSERSAPSDDFYDDEGEEENFLGLPKGQSTLFLFPEWMTGQAAPNYTDDPMLLNFPSSNDTELLVLKPMVVNLGSKSSKCTEIKTPVDPTKLRFIDNKRISIIIGCVAGILVFIFIIISIVMNREEKEEETEENDSMTGPKSPGSKTNRSDSLSFPHGNRGNNLPRNNSQSSSLLNTNRLSLAEAAGPDALPPRHVRNGSSASQPNTLKRGTLSRQQSRDTSVPIQPQKHSSSEQRPPQRNLMSKQSSTESGPSSSNRGLSRQSSSETGVSANRNNPYQSWHGTPRVAEKRVPNGGPELNSLPRRQSRRLSSNTEAAIPLIEYSFVENNGHYSSLENNQTGRRPRSDNRRSYTLHESEAAEAEDYYPDDHRPPPKGGYVKYNSFANY